MGATGYHYPEDVEVRDGTTVLKTDGQAVTIIPSAKMSKSKNNVVDPQAIIAQYGADTARWFVLSDSPPERDVEWTASGAEGAFRHLSRVWRIAQDIARADRPANDQDAALDRATARAIQDVTEGLDGFGFNKSVAKLYEFTNAITKSDAGAEARRRAMRVLAQLMAPMTPHLAEEIWHMLGGDGFVMRAAWPELDPALLVDDTVTLPIQINGKRKSEVTIARDADRAAIEAQVMQDAAVVKALDGGTPKKLIVVPGRIVNVVV